MSTSEAPAMTQAAIRKLVADSVSAALEAQAANMANTDNTTRPREAPVARQCSYKEFMSCQPFNFKGSEGAVGLIRWFERTESVFSRSNCTEDCKVKFVTGTLTEEALSWWNYFAQPIGIEEAYKITWELATLCPTMVPDSKKMIEVFIGGLPRSIEGNVTASKPQTLEEAINIAQRLMDQNRRQETFRAYAATPTENNRTAETKDQPLEAISNQYRFTCHACGGKGNYANQCRKTTNNNAQGRTYMLRDRNAHQDPNVVTGFDVVIGMDWLSKYLARIICDEKVIHILINGETLIIQVMEKKSDEKRLEDIPVVREFPEVALNDILIYSRNKEEHANHLRIILELLKKEKFYAKFSKCDFWIRIMPFLGHLIDNQGLHVDPAEIEAIKNWTFSYCPNRNTSIL
ncbi:hypothetical protein Tco_1143360 [Tanacetum coccineum]